MSRELEKRAEERDFEETLRKGEEFKKILEEENNLTPEERARVFIERAKKADDRNLPLDKRFRDLLSEFEVNIYENVPGGMRTKPPHELLGELEIELERRERGEEKPAKTLEQKI